ncbi:Hypothetical predicted protein [Mytilus galloprovincialis]|uniref:Uncharacterized protein n=1 Tax=Mytilus galloprovincialis TaxID=29158 RepID=A0A8B6CY11_MYTGA|nr:Hypothetical predicted protein [Mytilus galloprovincialis]
MFQQNWCYWLETGMFPSIGMLDEQKCCYGLDTEYSDFKEAIIATNRAEVTSKIESSAGEGGKRSHNSLDRFSPSKESSNSGEDNTDVSSRANEREPRVLPDLPECELDTPRSSRGGDINESK